MVEEVEGLRRFRVEGLGGLEIKTDFQAETAGGGVGHIFYAAEELLSLKGQLFGIDMRHVAESE